MFDSLEAQTLSWGLCGVRLTVDSEGKIGPTLPIEICYWRIDVGRHHRVEVRGYLLLDQYRAEIRESTVA